MEINYIAIGKRIRKRRKALGLTQAALAERADLSDTNMSHIERGATKLSLPSLISIANALDATADSLLMDVIDRSDAEFKRDFAELLQGCTPDEYRLLYNCCDAILNTLRR